MIRPLPEKSRRDMAHVDGDGCRSIDVPCRSCPSVTRIRLDPDVHAREKAILRAEIARLCGEVDRIAEEFREYKLLADLARTAGAGRFAEIAARIREAGAENLRDREAMADELERIRLRLAAASGNHSTEDAERIAELEARVRELEKKIRYYETPNSRRGMPSLYDKKAKEFDKELAESCGRPLPEAPRGPPMGHAGRSHHKKTERTIRFKPPRACPDCGSRRVAPSKQPESKTFVEMDEKSGRIRVYQLAVGRSWCGVCGGWKRSTEAPDIAGTWFGPVQGSHA